MLNPANFVAIVPFSLFSPFLYRLMFTRCSILLFLLLTGLAGYAQNNDKEWQPAQPAHYAFVHYDENVISNPKALDSFFYKLQMVRHSKGGRVNIIHIGDSHTQADGATSVMRAGMQDFFGNAGRGLVFPYQIANSNAPHDIRSSSSGAVWKSNRLTFPDKPIQTGISGYGIHSANPNATVNIGLKDMDGKQERFNRMVFFLCNDNVCYRMTDSNIASPITFNTTGNAADNSFTVNTDSMITGFQLAKVSSPNPVDYSFYGVSLEIRDSPGIIYHSIGVNGARYDQFLQNQLFWSQLKSLQGDLFVVSLGTNEAQNMAVNEQGLSAICDSFIHMIHQIAPHAVVLITTPAASYFRKKKPNKSMQNVADALKHSATRSNVSYWDLLHITSGVAGAAMWKKADLISHDLVHYNNAGYQLQGLLLLNAVAKGYNNYEKNHPYVAVKKAVVPATPGKPKVVKTEVVKATISNGAPVINDSKKPQPQQPAKPTEQPKGPVEQPVRPNSNIKVYYED